MPNHFPEEKYQKTEKEISGKEAPEMKWPEIEDLKEKVKKLEVQLKKERSSEERERIIKQEIKTYLEKFQKLPPFAIPQTARDEAGEIKKFPPSQQVGALISLVFEKGLREAISVARALDNPAILDEFHDILIDRYYQILIEKGILKFL